MVTLDNILKDEVISLIKIDVEGYDYNVLLGAKNILKKQHPYIFVEAKDPYIKKRIDNYLSPFGYRCKIKFNPASPTYFYEHKNSIVFNNLLDLKKVCDNLKIPFALAHGTLLGAYRDNDFIPGDEIDTDISINEEYAARAAEIFTELEKVGFKKTRYFTYKGIFRTGTIIRNGIHIDILITHKKGKDTYIIGPKKPISNKEYTAFVYPGKCFDKYDTIIFKDVKFNIPQNVEDFFIARYGKDWKIPKKWGLWGHLNPNLNPSLRPNYIIWKYIMLYTYLIENIILIW